MTPVILSAGDLSVHILTLGAIVQDVRLRGVDFSLTCGCSSLIEYQGACRLHGALIGPIANRISNARVKIESMMHELERNQDGRIHLHSGKDGTHLQDWTIVTQSDDAVTLELALPDGMCGLPGHRVIRATYQVSAPACLTLDITGTSDTDTMMNFANHSYWNLDGSNEWSGHHLKINADCYLPITDDATPTGNIADVTGTQMDLRSGRAVHSGTDVFDHNFCLSDMRTELRDVLELTGQNGLRMIMATTEPGLQIYDGRGTPTPYQGLAIEAQCWPDAPNNRKFPSIKLAAGDTYHQTTSWRFER
ncbi:MAG: aldose epimerase family protein [Yoonia sp.]